MTQVNKMPYRLLIYYSTMDILSKNGIEQFCLLHQSTWLHPTLALTDAPLGGAGCPTGNTGLVLLLAPEKPLQPAPRTLRCLAHRLATFLP